MEQSPSWEAINHSAMEFPACYGTWRFSTVFARAHHRTLLWATWIRFTHTHTHTHTPYAFY